MYFDESFLTIHWDEDTRAVWAEWKGAAGGEPLRRGLNAGLDLIVEKKANRWLADTKLLGAVSPEDMKWNDDWLPRAISAGVRWMAFVVPRKVVAQMALKAVVTRIDEHVVGIAYFDTIEEARAWLRAQK